MPQLSIRARLNLLIGTLLVLALAVNVALIVWSAGPRIRAENDSILKVTRETVDHALAEMQTSDNPDRDLAALLSTLTGLRHVLVSFEPPAGPPRLVPGQVIIEPAVPRWFTELVSAARPPLRIPARVGSRPMGSILIVSKPSDEIGEIWSAVTTALAGGLVLIAAVYALTSLAVRQALRPVRKLNSALGVMRDGNYEVTLEPSGPPELAGISARLNDLAAALRRTRADNSRLAEQIISIEDQERRELARELHDEFGPYLFAIRANLTALASEARREGSNAGLERAERCEGALAKVSALQQVNRRVLHKLRPPALTELGLVGALRALVALWRENKAGVEIALDVDNLTHDLDEVVALTIYRVVQEGLTNAFRHANARRIEVRVRQPAPGRLAVELSDDGSGLSELATPGFGISGMRERVWALGGTLNMRNRDGGGVALSVELPATFARAAPAT